MNKFYITTAIDYVNGTIHIGHAFQKVAADVLARYQRLKLGDDNVFFLTGTDEYGQKAEKSATEAGVDTKTYVRRISAQDKTEQDSLNISYNRFIETTDEDHNKVAQEIWQRAEANGDIYLGEYSGLYCTGCEAYYTEDDLVNGQCPFHPNLEIQKITEENYFFKWSKYQNFLIEHFNKHPEFVFPDTRRNEMLQFVKSGLKDIPISRTSFSWGVPVPNQPKHVMYVWFDALTNYLTGVGFLENPELFKKFWPADVHILGKDNARWHALLWPAMLKSAKLDLPQTILVNGFLGINGQKISKSLGNFISPSDWAKKFGADPIRYYLLRYNVLVEDGDISEEKLVQSYNSDLANGLGNLTARVAKLGETNQLIAPEPLKAFYPEVERLFAEYKLNEVLNFIWTQITEADKKVNEEKPWTLEGEKAKEVLVDLVKRIQQIAFNLQPFMPETSEKILKQFSGAIKPSSPLFPRI
jgi:methionyl-tRNA synthetase